MPSLQRWQKRNLPLLTPCNSQTALLTDAEYVALMVSLVGVPALAVQNSSNLNSIAFMLAKTLNSTSQALDALNREPRQV